MGQACSPLKAETFNLRHRHGLYF